MTRPLSLFPRLGGLALLAMLLATPACNSNEAPDAPDPVPVEMYIGYYDLRPSDLLHPLSQFGIESDPHLAEPDWQLVFRDSKAMLFRRAAAGAAVRTPNDANGCYRVRYFE